MQLPNITIAVAFLFAFLASVSIEWTKRIRYIVICACIFIIYLLLIVVNSGSVLPITKIQYFLALGIVLPQLLARFYIQYQIRSPLEFVNPKTKIRTVIILAVLMTAIIVFYISVAIQPSTMDYKTGEGIYSEADVLYKMSFVVMLILCGLFLLYLPFQRTAFCANGLLHQGLLWSWSNFKSYKWENEEIYLDADIGKLLDQNLMIGLTLHTKSKFNFSRAQLHYAVPYSNKETIDKILKQAFLS